MKLLSLIFGPELEESRLGMNVFRKLSISFFVLVSFVFLIALFVAIKDFINYAEFPIWVPGDFLKGDQSKRLLAS